MPTDDVLRGVALVGRPVATAFRHGLTVEVQRTATDGTPNTNSTLYGAAWRAARALGIRRLVTYTQRGESGASLRGAGWRIVAERPARMAGTARPARAKTTVFPDRMSGDPAGNCDQLDPTRTVTVAARRRDDHDVRVAQHSAQE